MNSDDSLVVFPTEREVESCACVCELPVLDEDILSCDSCDHLYHRRCVAGVGSHPPLNLAGESDGAGAWICHTCVQLLSVEEEFEFDRDTSDMPTVSGEQSEPPGTSETTTSTDKSTRKKQKVFRPASSITKKEVLEQKVQRLESILKDVENHKDFQTKHGYGQDVINLSMSVIKCTGDASFDVLSEELTSSLWEVATSGDKLPVGPSSTDMMWKRFHEYRMSNELSEEWTSFLVSCNIHAEKKHIVEQLLLQHVLRMLLLSLVREHNRPNEEEEAAPQVNLTNHDEHVLRYVSGYVPSHLIKRYKTQKSDTAQEYIHLLSSWRQEEVSSTSFLDYTSIWINIQDRGGLFHVNDDVFRLFRCMEKVTQQFLQVNKVGTMKKINLKAALSSQLLQDKHVRKMWGMAIEGRSGKIEWEPLLHSIVNYWTKIRLYAFAKIYMELNKKKALVSKRGEKGLRKELNR